MERLRLAINRRCNFFYVALAALSLGVLWLLSDPQQWFPKYFPQGLEKTLVKAQLTTQQETQREIVKKLPEKEPESKYNNGWSIPDDPGFIDYIKRKWIHYPSGVKSTMPGKDYSQLGEHKVVDDLLKQRRNGVFFEVGALDGITYSNTLGLEIIRNWTGILVEPDPASFAKMLRLKRNAYAINACLTTNKSEIREFIPAAGIGSLAETNRDKSANSRKIKVQCFPLYSILLAVGITKIDFFSLDVEGAEQIVLDSIPLDKVDIGLFVIEYLDISKEKKAKRLEGFRNFFEKHPQYKYVGEHHGVDALFQKW